MVTFPKDITDEEIELMSEKIQEEQQQAIDELRFKRKKLKETGVPDDDDSIVGIDELMHNI
jgi:hypothetical protein|tara:strand:- start:434 stop:616 length:183 start_codon:yes stop_codon:yes gene_type:complete